MVVVKCPFELPIINDRPLIKNNSARAELVQQDIRMRGKNQRPCFSNELLHPFLSFVKKSTITGSKTLVKRETFMLRFSQH